MTLKKKPAPRSYDTFPSSSDAADDTTSSKSDKTRVSAGIEAQRLASQNLWSDDYTRPVPPLNISTMGRESEAGFPRDEDPSDPPPIYTPSESTADPSSTPPSPMLARSIPQSVREPRSLSENIAHPTIPEEPQEDVPSDEAYASSPLLERAQPESETRSRGCSRWSREDRKHRSKRFRKALWFSCALAICLWLMLPALTRDNAGTRGPHWHHDPKDRLDESPLPAWPNPGRQYRRHETSSTISGTFKLYDLLDLSTTSGGININVEPQPGEQEAVMKISSSSGSVRINMGRGIMPWLPSSAEMNRTFQTTIKTSSGSVGGSLVAGNGGMTSIETSSGSIRLTFHALDLGPKSKISRLETISESGSQSLTVSSSSAHELRNLEARHLVQESGSLDIVYPRLWMGKLHMRSFGSGSMRASGSGLQFEQDGNREKYAWRGDGDLNEVEMTMQGSGSSRFSC